MSRIEHQVCSAILQRAACGLAKYGVTVERHDLSIVDWLRHLQEELLDAAVYVERIIDELEQDTD